MGEKISPVLLIDPELDGDPLDEADLNVLFDELARWEGSAASLKSSEPTGLSNLGAGLASCRGPASNCQPAENQEPSKVAASSAPAAASPSAAPSPTAAASPGASTKVTPDVSES